MVTRIAGHEFTDDSIDSCCVLAKSDGSPCIMTRSALFTATHKDINMHGVAHKLGLLASEYQEIDIARIAYQEKCERIYKATWQLASGL